jgi:hypothetical protein
MDIMMRRLTLGKDGWIYGACTVSSSATPSPRAEKMASIWCTGKPVSPPHAVDKFSYALFGNWDV